ncbi:MAG TPA: ABC transporter permease, partial [Candidatus Atribacteria bacterium]|nr:ABC transporter permease [Candidatus Atribacteria bacterium]
MKQWGPFIIEEEPFASPFRILLISIFSLVPPFLIMAFIFWIYGLDPWQTYEVIFQSLIASLWGWAEITRRAIPLLLCGTGLVVAFQAKFWNIGAEGQLLAGAVAATGIALFTEIPPPWLV